MSGRIFFVRLYLDEFNAALLGLVDDQERLAWLAGFQFGTTGSKAPSAWSGARLAGATFGARCYQASADLRAKQSEFGQKSASVRRSKNGTAQPLKIEAPSKDDPSTSEGHFEGMPNLTSILVSSTLESNTEKKVSNTELNRFDEFWNLYAKKSGKTESLKAWSKMSDEDRSKAIGAIPEYIKLQPDVKYRLDPVRYLGRRKWEDEIVQISTHTASQDEPSYPKIKLDEYDRSKPLIIAATAYNGKTEDEIRP